MLRLYGTVFRQNSGLERLAKEKVFKRELRALDEVIKTYEGAMGDKLEAVLNSDVYEKMLAETEAHSQDTV